MPEISTQYRSEPFVLRKQISNITNGTGRQRGVCISSRLSDGVTVFFFFLISAELWRHLREVWTQMSEKKNYLSRRCPSRKVGAPSTGSGTLQRLDILRAWETLRTLKLALPDVIYNDKASLFMQAPLRPFQPRGQTQIRSDQSLSCVRLFATP